MTRPFPNSSTAVNFESGWRGGNGDRTNGKDDPSTNTGHGESLVNNVKLTVDDHVGLPEVLVGEGGDLALVPPAELRRRPDDLERAVLLVLAGPAALGDVAQVDAVFK